MSLRRTERLSYLVAGADDVVVVVVAIVPVVAVEGVLSVLVVVVVLAVEGVLVVEVVVVVSSTTLGASVVVVSLVVSVLQAPRVTRVAVSAPSASRFMNFFICFSFFLSLDDDDAAFSGKKSGEVA